MLFDKLEEKISIALIISLLLLQTFHIFFEILSGTGKYCNWEGSTTIDGIPRDIPSTEVDETPPVIVKLQILK